MDYRVLLSFLGLLLEIFRKLQMIVWGPGRFNFVDHVAVEIFFLSMQCTWAICPWNRILCLGYVCA
jgi:hypothetical protein